MTAATLLSRLEKVRPSGADRWSASCPSHQGKNPSLSIRELPDGRVLVRCWAGCDVLSIFEGIRRVCYRKSARDPARASAGAGCDAGPTLAEESLGSPGDASSRR